MPHASHRYLLSLGSNRPLSARLDPRALLREATARIGASAGIGVSVVLAASPIFITPPLGPSRRVYANAALLIESALAPDALLDAAQRIERALGRQRHRRWGARRLDIDIILWSGGAWRSPSLTIPHPAFRTRDFVLRPLLAVAAGWRDPATGLSVRQLNARLHKAAKRACEEVDQRPARL